MGMQNTEEVLRHVAMGLDDIFNPGKTGDQHKVGFVLLTFPFGEPDSTNVNYISNGERKDILIAMKEVVARFEGRYLHQPKPGKDRLS